MFSMQKIPFALRHPIDAMRNNSHAKRLKLVHAALNELKVLKGFREAYPVQNADLTSSFANHVTSMQGRASQRLKFLELANMLISLQKACASDDSFYSSLNALAASPTALSFTARNTQIINGFLMENKGRSVEDFFSTLAGIGPRENYRTVQFSFVCNGKSVTLVKIGGEWEIKGNTRTVVPSEDIPYYSVAAFRYAPVLTGA